VEALWAHDVLRQGELTQVLQEKNNAEASASQISTKLSSVESQLVRAAQDLSVELSRRNDVEARLHALCSAAVVIADNVLGASTRRLTSSSIFVRFPIIFGLRHGRSPHVVSSLG
jgi:hypothetical protein